jgi:hypothetical protein
VAPASATADQRLGGKVRRQPVVRYYQRMLRGRLYSLDVRLNDESGRGDGSGASGSHVLVRPVIPGAQVSPPSAELSTAPGSTVRFWVQPMCRGRLRDARVEFRSGSQMAGHVPLRMRVATRRLTWFCLLLAIVLPCVLYYFKAINPIEPKGLISEARRVPPPVPTGVEGGDAAPAPPGGAAPKVDAPAKVDPPPTPPDEDEEAEEQPPTKTDPPPRGGSEGPARTTPRGGGGAPGGGPGAVRPGGGGVGPRMPGVVRPSQGGPGTVEPMNPDRGPNPILLVPYSGSEFIEKWLEREAGKPTSLDEYDTRDFVVVGLYQLKGPSYFYREDPNQPPMTAVAEGYYWFDFARKMQLSEIYLALTLLTLTLIVGILQSPARGRKKGPVLELAG